MLENLAEGADVRRTDGRAIETSEPLPGPDGTRGSAAARPALRLGLLRGFQLVDCDRQVQLPLSAQRVLAFLALHDRSLQRVYIAGSLWLDATEARSTACLRTALWRLRRPDCCVVNATPTHVSLSPNVQVDVTEAKAAAASAIAGGAAVTHESASVLCGSGDILPDWYEDWVLAEREHFRQLRLHALEALCEDRTAEGRFVDAIEAGLAAVEGEPLRESAHRALIKAYLSEGNAGEALRQYDYFRRVLSEQLRLEPSALMDELMGAVPFR
jgi:DNA-binding SARP family transcriptional activator